MTTQKTTAIDSPFIEYLEKRATAPQDQVAEGNIVRIEQARQRRGRAHGATAKRDEALGRLQQRYVILGEPAAIWDKHEQKFLTKQGFSSIFRSPKYRKPRSEKYATLADLFLDDPGTACCHYPTFRPGKDEIDGDYLNLWTKSDTTPVEGDATPFLNHMAYIYDDEQESIDFTLNWMALPLQQLGTKMETGILIAGEQGTGKTMIGDILRKLHGEQNSVKIKGEELRSSFNDYMKSAALVVVEEVCLKDRWDLMDSIKDAITSTKVRVNMKHVSPYEIDNVANFVLFSNHSNALAIPDGDRRWHVHVSPRPPKEPGYYEYLRQWLEEKSGYGIILHHLLHRNLSNFKPYTKPPLSRSKSAMAFASKSSVEQEIYDAIQDRTGLFESDLVTLKQVNEKYLTVGIGDKPNEASIRHAMQRLAVCTDQRVRIKLKLTASADPENKTKEEFWRVWSVRNHEKWKKASHDEIREELKKVHTGIVTDK